MGSHVWAYKKIGKFDDLVTKELAIKGIKNFIQWLHNTNIKSIEYNLLDKEFTTMRDAVNSIAHVYRMFRLIVNNDIKLLHNEVKEQIIDYLSFSLDEWKDKEFIIDPKSDELYVFEEVEKYYNMFRVGEYDLEAWNRKEAEEIINKFYNSENPYRGGKLKSELFNEFWEKYPNGLIVIG